MADVASTQQEYLVELKTTNLDFWILQHYTAHFSYRAFTKLSVKYFVGPTTIFIVIVRA
jgi:hypothetical protein